MLQEKLQISTLSVGMEAWLRWLEENKEICYILYTYMYGLLYTCKKLNHVSLSISPFLLIAQVLKTSQNLPYVSSVFLGHLEHILPDGCWEDKYFTQSAKPLPAPLSSISEHEQARSSPPPNSPICLFLHLSNLNSSPTSIYL